MAHTYKHPPITEAVVELRFEQAFSQDAIEKAARRLDKEYVFSDPESTVNFNIDVDAQKTQVGTQWHGVRLSSIDRTDLTLLRSNAFVCARLAPYRGWEEFKARSERDWAAWKRAAGFTRITRIGLRFVNRIDIPVDGGGPVPFEEYIAYHPRLPNLDLPPISAYAMQVVQPLGVDECNATLASASVPSPLLGHASFVLDIDVAREVDVPQRDEDIWLLLERMRGHKNRLFEGCVTDRARDLFER